MRASRRASIISACSISRAAASIRTVSWRRKWLVKAAEQGYADAALDYGVLVFRGEGVQKDEKIGAQWLLVAAKRGNVVAENRVARLYAFGKGVAADPVEAMKWNILANKGGRPDAELDALFVNLTAEQKAQAQALADAFKPQGISRLLSVAFGRRPPPQGGYRLRLSLAGEASARARSRRLGSIKSQPLP